MKKFFTFDPQLLFYGFAIIFFASYGQTFFISIFNLEIRNFYNLTDGEFGFIYSLGTLASSLILVAFAKLIDFIDLRVYSFIVSIGLAFSCMAFYLSSESVFLLFFIIFCLRFFGQGAMSHAGETTMARYFGKNRGKALSISTLGGMIGVMILPLIIVTLTGSIGWKNVWLVSGLSILFFFIPLIFLTLFNQSKRHSNFFENSKNFLNKRKWRTREVIFDKNFYIYLPITMTMPFISTGLTFHQIFIIQQKGWTLQMLGNGFIFLGIFSIFGLLISGPIVDRYNAKRIVIYTLSPLLFAILVLLFFKSYFFMMFYMSLLGFGLGASTPILGSLWAEIYGLESLGTVKALLHALMVFFSALSPMFFGYMIDFGLGIPSLSLMSLIIISFSILLPVIFEK